MRATRPCRSREEPGKRLRQWLRWLQQQGWSTEAKISAWPQSTKANTRTAITPVQQRRSRLPIDWAHYRIRRKQREAQGRGWCLEEPRTLGNSSPLPHRSVAGWHGFETGASEKPAVVETRLPPTCVGFEGPLMMRLLLVHQNFLVNFVTPPSLCDRGRAQAMAAANALATLALRSALRAQSWGTDRSTCPIA